MVSFQINRFIHSVIRENKLILLLNAIIDENVDVFQDFSKQLKKFLKKEHDTLFDRNREKYITYLDNLKQNLGTFSSLKDKDITKTSLMFYKLYELPKKRNNLFLVYLVYFYIKNKNILGCSEIFKIIYIYFILIVYRNRLDNKKRAVFIELDATRFLTLKTILQKKIKKLSGIFAFYKSNFRYIFGVLFSIFAIGIYYIIDKNNLFLKTSVLETPKEFSLTKTAFESFLTGNATGAMFSGLNDFSVQSILILVLIIVVIQSVRGNLKTLFIDTIIAKIFSFITFISKMTCRIIFYIYNYIIYKIETEFIFATLYGIVKNKIIFNNFFLSVFTIIYFGIYVGIIYLYIAFANYIYPNYILGDFGILIAILLSILLIYINIRNDIMNFKEFLMETEKVLLFLKEGKID